MMTPAQRADLKKKIDLVVRKRAKVKVGPDHKKGGKKS